MSYLTARWNIFGLHKCLLWLWIPAVGFYVGKYFDDEEIARSTTFRDKSKLFGGFVKPGDPPSWGPGSKN